MPPDVGDIQRLADFLESMEAYRRLASTSSIFQTFAITAVILRLLVMASVLPRVSLITLTLKRSIVPLLYFMLPFTVILVLFAALGTISFGQRVESLSSFSQSLETILEFVFFGGSSLTTELTPEGVVLHPIEATVATAFKLSLTCLSIFIFMNFVLAILTDNFLEEKEQQATKDDPSAEDLSAMGGEIYKALSKHFQDLKKRPRHVVPSLSDIGRCRSALPVKKPALSESIRAPSSVTAAQEIELTTPPRVIYINELPASESSESEEEFSRLASIPIKRFEDAASEKSPFDCQSRELVSSLERLDDRVRALLETYATARQWAVHARIDLIQTEWLDPITHPS